jgi:hypothetical protein
MSTITLEVCPGLTSQKGARQRVRHGPRPAEVDFRTIPVSVSRVSIGPAISIDRPVSLSLRSERAHEGDEIGFFWIGQLELEN